MNILGFYTDTTHVAKPIWRHISLNPLFNGGVIR